MTPMTWSMISGVHLLGWALLHFLWQGALIGLVYVAVRTVLPRGEMRYRWGMAMLTVMAVCPFWTIWRSLEVGALPQSSTVLDLGVIAAATGHSWSWMEQLNAMLPWLVLLWAIGVLFLTLRVALQWRGLRQLSASALPLAGWDERIAAMAARFGLGRPVRVLCSKGIVAPALLGGWLRPVILLPLALACDFPVKQIELILAHEMAHVRRWDPAANLFQVGLETLHFYHPVVRWISRDVRHEREICCDEMALSLGGGSRHEFVAMLADLGDFQDRHSDLLLAFTGGSLLDRVQHLVMPTSNPVSLRAPGRLLAALVCASLVAFVLQVQWNESRLQGNLSHSLTRMELMALRDTFPLVLPQLSLHMPAWSPLRVGVVTPGEKDLAQTEPAISAISRVPLAENLVLAPRLKLDEFSGALSPALALAAHPVHVVRETPSVAPVPVYIRQPLYPQSALNSGIQGKVVVEFTLDSHGAVANPVVVAAVPAGMFDRSAIEALRYWRYAVPAGTAGVQKYRQTLAFGLGSPERGSPAQAHADVQVRAKVPCEMVTGSHICHTPGASPSLADNPVE